VEEEEVGKEAEEGEVGKEAEEGEAPRHKDGDEDEDENADENADEDEDEDSYCVLCQEPYDDINIVSTHVSNDSTCKIIGTTATADSGSDSGYGSVSAPAPAPPQPQPQPPLSASVARRSHIVPLRQGPDTWLVAPAPAASNSYDTGSESGIAVVKMVLQPCCHAFCSQCMFKWRKRTIMTHRRNCTTCPKCRTVITKFGASHYR
jgi:hypothetical protein